MIWEWMIYTGIILLILIIGYEFLKGRMIQEGFTDGESQVPEFFGRFFPKRHDVVPGQEKEEDGWIRNPRYFEGYADVQKLGYKADFCRVIEKEGDPMTRIMACALAGTEGLDSMTFRTASARSGVQFSRDDYFADVNNDGRDDYCRIVKVKNAPEDTWESRCIPAGYTRFKQGIELQDTNPPQHIADLLWFFEGAMVWYRWFDDMLDYAENTRLLIAGDAKVDETPRRELTEALALNRIPSADVKVAPPSDQFLKIGENNQMEFDSKVELRQLRAICVWAYFDEFTNNARIFDFGNGAGKDNVLLGIMGRGNEAAGGDFGRLDARPSASNAVCRQRSPKEVSPLKFLESTDANIDEWECPGPEAIESFFPEDEIRPTEGPKTANLLFEIWDSQQRKMRIIVPDAIPYRKWVHIALTTTDMDLLRPTWQVYVNAKKVYEADDGHMPLTSYTTKNYIGKSNWETDTSQYNDRDERFRGSLFDFRLYRIPMTAAKIKKSYEWGQHKLKELSETVRLKTVTSENGIRGDMQEIGIKPRKFESERYRTTTKID